jgi:hypothetical protein
MLDSLFGTGKLEKMIICALKPIVKDQPPEVSDKDTDKYMVQVNPDSYSLNHNVRYERNNTPGSAGDEPKFDHISPTSLDFSIIFDGTGVVPKPAGPLDNVPGVGAVVGAISGLLGDSEEYDVMKEIRKFATVVYDIDGGTHEPRKVRLTWGRQLYDGVLTSLSLNYKLFKPDGTPLRVEARLSFESVLFDIMNEAEVKKASPDLTHVRKVIAGDTLPLMTHNIYGKASYYIEVARANKIINFRKLREGRSVFFPPTKKTSE